VARYRSAHRTVGIGNVGQIGDVDVELQGTGLAVEAVDDDVPDGGGGPLLGGGAERHQDDKTEQQAERGQRASEQLHPNLPNTTASAGQPSTPLRYPSAGFQIQ